jgi:hypothetical protein
MFTSKSKKEEQLAARKVAEAEEVRIKNEKLQRIENERQEKIREFKENFKKKIENSVDLSGSAQIFHQIYLPVDAQMNQMEDAMGLDLRDLNRWGISGWQVISVIPRTYGGFQSYKVSKTNAYGMATFGKDVHQSGLGGHVIGVYVVLGLSINKNNLDNLEGDIDWIAEESIPDSLVANQE